MIRSLQDVQALEWEAHAIWPTDSGQMHHTIDVFPQRISAEFMAMQMQTEGVGARKLKALMAWTQPKIDNKSL